MRKIFLTAALLATIAGGAQAQVGCRGETLSALNDCIAANTPEVQTPTGDANVERPQPPGRVTLGGALQPRNLRATPPPTALPYSETGTQLPGAAYDPDAPSSLVYGEEGAAARASRDVLDAPPLRPNVGTGYLRDIPGTFATR